MPSVPPEQVAPGSRAHPAPRSQGREAGLAGQADGPEQSCLSQPVALGDIQNSSEPGAVTFGDRTEVPKAWTPASTLAWDSSDRATERLLLRAALPGAS